MALEYVTATEKHALPAALLYEHRGYRTTGHGIIDLENDVKLVFDKMEKMLR